MNPKRLSLKLTQEEADSIGLVLMRDSDTTNRYSADQPPSDATYRLLSVFRHAVTRAGGEDMYPDLPHIPGIFEGQPKPKRRRG